MESQYFTAMELAERFKLGLSTVYKNVSRGTLPKPLKIGGLYRWKIADIEAFEERRI